MTTFAKALMPRYPRAQYLNWDVANDRRIILGQTWSPRAKLLVLNEIHKMRDWKAHLKGAWDGRGEGQSILVTGSARMDTFRHGDAPACLLRDGVLVAAAEEARFRRVKHWAGFPTEAIRHCLRQGGVQLGDVARVVRPGAVFIFRNVTSSCILIRWQSSRFGSAATLWRL
jgi:hypothetical protein